MRFFWRICVGLVLVVSAHAQTIHSDADLDALMKEMGPMFKELAKGLSNPSLNSQSFVLAQNLGDRIYLALTMLPKKVLTASEAEQTRLIVQYRDVMGRLYVATVAAQNALLLNDNEAAIVAVKRMNDIKSEGHNLFDPPSGI